MVAIVNLFTPLKISECIYGQCLVANGGVIQVDNVSVVSKTSPSTRHKTVILVANGKRSLRDLIQSSEVV